MVAVVAVVREITVEEVEALEELPVRIHIVIMGSGSLAQEEWEKVRLLGLPMEVLVDMMPVGRMHKIQQTHHNYCPAF